jgi:hypothetical protein
LKIILHQKYEEVDFGVGIRLSPSLWVSHLNNCRTGSDSSLPTKNIHIWESESKKTDFTLQKRKLSAAQVALLHIA